MWLGFLIARLWQLNYSTFDAGPTEGTRNPNKGLRLKKNWLEKDLKIF